MKNATIKNTAAEPPPANASEFESLLRSAMDELMVRTRTHQDAWNFGQEEQWFLDQGSAELSFTFPDVVVSAPAQIIGTWQQDTGIWTWAWADPTVPAPLQEDSYRLREYGEHHGFQHLLTESWQAEESHCWYMTALACWLCDAKGAYRGVAGNTCTFITFREVSKNSVPELLTDLMEDDICSPVGERLQAFLNSSAEEFKRCSAFPEEQRKACCRYLSKGALEGIDQAELIHHLGLASPSVLDLAGYCPDSAQNVMDILKTISDEEIELYAEESRPLEPES